MIQRVCQKDFSNLIIFLAIWVLALNIGQASSQTSSESLMSPCEKTIHLSHLHPEKVIYNEDRYSIHYKYEDVFPSKKIFFELQRQLLECGWKNYNSLEEVFVNDKDWLQYFKGRTDEETVVVHRFGKTYIDKERKRLAIILLQYISKPSDIREIKGINKPNNNIQFITLQFMPFNEEEYRKKLDEYIQKSKSGDGN